MEEPAAWAGVTSTHVLSVVIPAYNEERYIAATLERVLAVDLSIVGFSREVIVVDDHSSDLGRR